MDNDCRTQGGRKVALTAGQETTIDKCVKKFESKAHLFQKAAEGVILAFRIDPTLKKFIHFIKYRIKDPEHLRAKLTKRALEEKKKSKKISINEDNLYEKITDLAGVRILHLYTDQIEQIHKCILSILKYEKYKVNKPVAYIWDIEADTKFKQLGFRTIFRDSMYASLHYDIILNKDPGVRCELQVRTLADELWGEVSHTIDYPIPSHSIACKEQLKVLARVTSGCTRLVDSIFRSREEYDKLSLAQRGKRKK